MSLEEKVIQFFHSYNKQGYKNFVLDQIVLPNLCSGNGWTTPVNKGSRARSLRLVYIGVFARRFRRTFSPKVSITSEPSISHFYDCTLGRDVLKNRTFSIFQTASPQGFPLNLPCLNLYLWRKTCTSMAKTSDENAEQKRQCKRALKRICLGCFYGCKKT